MEYTKGFLSVTDKLEELLADGSRQSLSDAYRLAVKHTHLAAECAQTIVESIVDCKDGSMRKNKLSVLESLSVRKEFQEFIIELFPILIKSFESLPRLSFSYARGLLSILNSLGPEAPAMFSSFYSKLESVIASNGVSATMSSEDVVNQKRRATVLNTIDMTRDKVNSISGLQN